jgi:hypothetical protein
VAACCAKQETPSATRQQIRSTRQHPATATQAGIDKDKYMLRNTKILATLGPASSTPQQILALARAGVNVFRLNMSHGSHDDHRARLAAIRAAETEMGRPIGVLVDLQGPKLRIGTFRKGRSPCAWASPTALCWTRWTAMPARSPCPTRKPLPRWNTAITSW